jgi:hypothetical protein
MPRIDLSAVTDRIVRLIRVLEAFRHDLRALDPIERAQTELLEALHPGGMKDGWGSAENIIKSDLDLPVKARLKGLRRFLLDRSFSLRAIQEREETIVFLNDLLTELEGGSTAANPGPADKWQRLRDFAGSELRGMERAVVEALCDAGGELRLEELAFCRGVNWRDLFRQKFKNVQHRLNRKPKFVQCGFALVRRDNRAILRAKKRKKSN